MAKESTIAPRERVNITYKPATGGAKEEVELPMKLIMLGDYTQREDDRALQDRDPVSIDKDNFESVMAEHRLELSFSVPDRLTGEEDAELPVSIRFDKMEDFTPGRIAEQVPELNQLLELRRALAALKGPLANTKQFEKTIQGFMDSEADVKKLMDELNLGDSEADK